MRNLYKLIAEDFKLAQMLLKTSPNLDEDGETTIVATSFGRAYMMKDLIPIDNEEIESAVFNFINYKTGFFIDNFLLENIFTDQVNAITDLVNNNSIPSRVVMAQIIHVYSLFCALKMCALADEIANKQFVHFKNQLLAASLNWIFNEHLNTRLFNFINSHGVAMHEDFKQILNNARVK